TDEQVRIGVADQDVVVRSADDVDDVCDTRRRPSGHTRRRSGRQIYMDPAGVARVVETVDSLAAIQALIDPAGGDEREFVALVSGGEELHGADEREFVALVSAGECLHAAEGDAGEAAGVRSVDGPDRVGIWAEKLVHSAAAVDGDLDASGKARDVETIGAGSPV